VSAVWLEKLFWNRYARSYDKLANYYQPYKNLVQEVCDLIDSYAQGRSLKILDAGCGTGNYAIELAQRGHTVVGIDSSPIMISKARIKNQYLPTEQKLTLITHDLGEKLPFTEKYFDAIISIHVLYTLPDQKSFLAELSRVASRPSMIIIVNSCTAMTLHATAAPQWRMSKGLARVKAFVSLLSVGFWNYIISRREKNGTYGLTTSNELRELLLYIDARNIEVSESYVGSASAIGYLK